MATVQRWKGRLGTEAKGSGKAKNPPWGWRRRRIMSEPRPLSISHLFTRCLVQNMNERYNSDHDLRAQGLSEPRACEYSAHMLRKLTTTETLGFGLERGR